MFRPVILSVLFLLSSPTGAANSLTLFVIPPPQKLSWNSPRSITSTALLSSINSQYHSIGHVTAKVECSYKGQHVSFWTGMTSAKDNPSDNDLLLKEKLGLGIFFYSYNGHLESEEEILINTQKARDMIERLFSLKFLINEQHCERIHHYFVQYQAYRVNEIYGLVHRPRYLEGAGCTAYAVSFLEVAGLLDPELKEAWGKGVRVPENLIGHGDHQVSIPHLLTVREARNWAEEHEPHRKLHFYDTSFFYEWAQEINKLKELPAGVARDEEAKRVWHKYVRTRESAPGRDRDRHLTRSNGFFGLIFDRRSWTASDEPLWLN